MESQQLQDHQLLAEPIKEAREVGLVERAGALVMLGFGMSPLVVGWVFMWRRDFALGEFIAVNVIAVFAFAVIETFSIIILWGLKRLQLPERFVHWLGAATVGEVAGILALIIKVVFRAEI